MFALSFQFFRQRVSANDLRANEGRETKALNCKPNTNLKEISELSNYSKTSGFRLHAVIGCPSFARLLFVYFLFINFEAVISFVKKIPLYVFAV
jgi:hypothetical protein